MVMAFMFLSVFQFRRGGMGYAALCKTGVATLADPKS